MEKKTNEQTTPENGSRQNVERNTDASGLHQQRAPKGADKMDESFSKPDTNNQPAGDSSRYANTSDNEE